MGSETSKGTVIYPDVTASRSNYNHLESDELLVSDIFATLQGEGPFAGRRAMFVRFAGCNLGGKTVNGPGCPFCFERSARVLMANGREQPISALSTGDRVASYDIARARVTRRRITRVYTSETDALVRVLTRNQLGLESSVNHFLCTPDHPMYDMDEGQWEPASARSSWTVLRRGSSYLRGRIGAHLSSFPVYNLEVEGTHTYIVQGHLVHNCDTDFRLNTSRRTTFDKVIGLIEERAPALAYTDYGSDELIVITGGEPLLQSNIAAFIRRLRQRWPLIDIQIETNGTHYTDVADAYLVVSPKVPEVKGKSLGYGRLSDRVWHRANCLKLLVSADAESPYYTLPDFAFTFRDSGRPVYLSPINVYEREPIQSPSLFDHDLLNQQACRANHERAARLCMLYGFSLSVQQHLLAGLA